MNSKINILKRIASSNAPQHPYPDLDFPTQQFPDKLVRFQETAANAGCRTILLAEGGDPNQLIRELFPESQLIASSLPEIDAPIRPEEFNDSRKLEKIEVAVVQGKFGVAENGAVWLPLESRHKALYFAPEHLIVLLPRTALVDTMQDAMSCPWFNPDTDFGCFMSGPSKTADIEQALVIGVHGPLTLTIILL